MGEQTMLELEKEVIDLLGGEKLLGKSIHNTFDLIDLIQQKGFPVLALLYIKHSLQIKDKELAINLGVSEKTIHRYRDVISRRWDVSTKSHFRENSLDVLKKLSRDRKNLDSRLNPATSDRLYRLAKVYAMAVEVFAGKEEAQKWLHTPQIGLNNRIPLELIATEAGSQEVKNLLGRIEHGVFS